MKNENFPKAYKEIMELLKYLPKESIDKIPKEIIQTFELGMDKNYNYVLTLKDIEKDFSQYNLLDETKAILAILFRDYWADPYQREQIIAKENYDKQKKLEEKYNIDNLFKNKQENKTTIQAIDISTLSITKRESFFNQLMNFILKYIFRKKDLI